MHRRRFITTTAGLLVPLVAGCTSGGDGGSGSDVVETTEVSMVDNQFDPRNIQVAAGATVTWTNDDDHGHTVTSASDNWSFDTRLDGGATTEFTFEESGVYETYCQFHGESDLSGMSLKIAVGDATIEAPLGSSEQQGGGY